MLEIGDSQYLANAMRAAEKPERLYEKIARAHVNEGFAASNRRPSSSNAARVFAASGRCSAVHHSAMAMLP